jgi:hypothetical protein
MANLGASYAPSEDVEDFIDNVNEVSRLIDGLAAGTLPPDYIDRRIEERRVKVQQKQKAQSPRGSAPKPALNHLSPRDAASARDGGAADADAAAAAAEQEAARQAELQRKVEELKANRASKLRARARYEEYVQQRQQHAASAGAVDYHRWDLWCPEDEEDELFSSLTPNDAGFRAMERDINERHKR